MNTLQLIPLTEVMARQRESGHRQRVAITDLRVDQSTNALLKVALNRGLPHIIIEPLKPEPLGAATLCAKDFCNVVVFAPDEFCRQHHRATGRSPEQEALFNASGRVELDGKLECFLYLLMRDHLYPGQLAEVMKKIGDETCSYTNGWLAKYAEYLAKELR